MQDDSPTIPMASMPPRRRGSAGRQLLVLLLAFGLGAGLVAYFAWTGDLSRYLPARAGADQSPATGGDARTTARGQATPASPAPAAVLSLEARMAMLEDRFSRLDFEARAASGNAARAEGLLIASAARRTVERGEPLGAIEDQLRLRFGDAQPQAVDTIIQFSQTPVTIDQLTARLEALTPNLTDSLQGATWWERARQEVASLFIVRSDSPTLLAPAARVERARLMLTERRIGNAIDEVARLPGAEAAEKWTADARRFQDAERALELIETTALVEPRRLRDGSGQQVNEPSPTAGVSAAPVAPAPSETARQ